MKIELKEITVRELTNGYKDDAENGIIGFGGKLDSVHYYVEIATEKNQENKEH